MGKKINPISFRIGINKGWKSKWFDVNKSYSDRLEEDIKVRNFIKKKWKNGAIKEVIIKRAEGIMNIKILAGRPGVIIGRGGSGIEEIKKGIISLLMSIRSKRLKTNKNLTFDQKINNKNNKIVKTGVEIDVQEVRDFEENAVLVAQNVAEQLEKRVSFRRVLKSTLDSVSKQRAVKGVKIMVSGRLNGADMSRKEWVIRGGIPLHTLRADIDFGKTCAYTTYGVIGVKVWIYKGEVFKKESKER
ncbi:MAG: 30S ribosomal protein S3 [Candidatus Moranbacteria bacterium]|nr:30S ribosomal protein S3 [Candidatus Moranbacteria bacterium]